MTEDVAINELLSKNLYTKEMPTFVSEGRVCIPFDDGEPLTTAQRIADAKSNRNGEQAKLDILNHSQRVLEVQEAGILTRLSELEKESVTPGSKEAYDKNTEIKDEIKRLNNVLDQTRNQINTNKAEVTRLATNIAVYEETIAELQNE